MALNDLLLSNRSIYLSLSYQERSIGLLEIVKDFISYLNAPCYYFNLSQKSFTKLGKGNSERLEIKKAPLIDDDIRSAIATLQQDLKIPVLPRDLNEFEKIIAVLKSVYSAEDSGIYILENIDNLISNPRIDVYEKEKIKTWLINITQKFQHTKPGESNFFLILLGTSEINQWELQNIIPQVRLPFVAPEEISTILKYKFNQLKLADNAKSNLIAKAGGILSGLTKPEIEYGINLISNSLEIEPSLETYLTGLLNYKIEKLKDLGLEFLPPPEFAEVGGMDLLKLAIQDLQNEFAPQARRDRIPLPKGWIMGGIPGVGKSFLAKCMAQKLRLPLIYVAIDKVLSKGGVYLANLLRQIEASSPNICYFDEFDKLFPPEPTAQSEEIKGVLLTWLQEKKGQTFVLATLNRLDRLPPEMCRAGRFDRLFYLGFPQPIERIEITKLHLKHYDNRFAENFDFEENEWRLFLNETVKFTGAELANVVQKTIRHKYRQKMESQKTSLLKIEAQERKILALFDESIGEESLLWNNETEDILNIGEKVKCNPEILIGATEAELENLLQEIKNLREEYQEQLETKLEIDFETLFQFAHDEKSLFERNPEGVLAIENRAREICEPVSSKDTSGWIPDDYTFWPDKPPEPIQEEIINDNQTDSVIGTEVEELEDSDYGF
jgi:SpoVK/Ycf46/Vps4 family AAA+-type ATPase